MVLTDASVVLGYLPPYHIIKTVSRKYSVEEEESAPTHYFERDLVVLFAIDCFIFAIVLSLRRGCGDCCTVSDL